MSVKISTFEKDGKQYPTMELRTDKDAKFAFTFGVSKAKLIVEHIDEINQFVEDNSL